MCVCVCPHTLFSFISDAASQDIRAGGDLLDFRVSLKFSLKQRKPSDANLKGILIYIKRKSNTWGLWAYKSSVFVGKYLTVGRNPEASGLSLKFQGAYFENQGYILI